MLMGLMFCSLSFSEIVNNHSPPGCSYWLARDLGVCKDPSLALLHTRNRPAARGFEL